MPNLSLKQFLELRKADPGKGIKCLAPDLKVISLKSLINMERIVIHLSDLHIGLNNNEMIDGTATNQAKTVFDNIKKIYATYDPKPIVIITGDLVDYGFNSDNKVPLYWEDLCHPDGVSGLLDDLSNAGFKVLVSPGNHDYSDEFDVGTVSWKVEGDITGALKGAFADIANKKGSSPKYVSGMTYVEKAFTNFHDHLRNIVPYVDSGVYQEFWRKRGAAFDLDFILVDAEDKEPKAPDWTDVLNHNSNPYIHNDLVGSITISDTEFLEVVPKFFLRNKFLRLAHGYIDKTMFETLRGKVDNAITNGSLPVVCLHHWVNYGFPRIVNYRESEAIAILNVLLEKYYPGTTFGAFVPINPFSHGEWIAKTPNNKSERCNNPNFDGYGEGSLWNEVCADPMHSDLQGSEEPVPLEDIFQLLDSCHLLLVGHRHKPNNLQDLREEFSKLKEYWKAGLDGARYFKSQIKDSKELDKCIIDSVDILVEKLPWLRSSGHYSTLTKARRALSFAKLDFDLEERFNKVNNNKMLAYYHEAGSPVPNPDNEKWDGPRKWDDSNNGYKYRSWAELRINLHTGKILFKQIECS